MKICFLASANSTHIIKWSQWFASQGHQVEIISFETDKGTNPYAKIHSIPIGFNPRTANSIRKLAYLTHGREIQKLVQSIQPDVVNVHYASSYGVAAALAGIAPYILSLWGSDIYDFPKTSFFHRKSLEFSLQRASVLFSTSKAMADEAGNYTNKPIEITPFGVDIDLFRPREHANRDVFVVGTVKTLAPKYGIEYLIKAVSIIRKEHPEVPIRLRIAGKGKYEASYKALASNLGLEDITTWLGFISQEQAAVEWAGFDVAVAVSDSESFGVAAVESQACGTPIIISDVPGLMESTCPGESSIVVPRRNERALAGAILRLYEDKGLRMQMGQAGRRYVLENFELNRCFEIIEVFFARFVAGDL